MARVLEPRKVDAQTEEVIALVVAAINNCDVCLNAHSGTLRRRYGFDDQGIAEMLATVALWSEVTRFNIAGRRDVAARRACPGADGGGCLTWSLGDPMTLELLDWRRRVAAMYMAVRASATDAPADALSRFRADRDQLFREHPASPLGPARRARFARLPYWPHDPSLRFEAVVDTAPPEPVVASSIGGETFGLVRIGRVQIPVGDLEVYWVDVYGGGIFVPFRDATSGYETYGGGRYLLDTVKGADLGGQDGRLVLDFNYAYHPSCAYDPRWSCPLAPPANRLDAPVLAGERLR
jgi:AhpD family alkylhydroperoxidase